jgi:PTS system nitrogen regulatory IIA component
MKLVDILPPGAVSVDLAATSKKECWKSLCGSAGQGRQVARCPKAMVRTLLEREALGSTGHWARGGHPSRQSARHQSPSGGLGISKRGVDFDALDGEPVHIVFFSSLRRTRRATT